MQSGVSISWLTGLTARNVCLLGSFLFQRVTACGKMATPSDGIGYIQNGPSGPYVHLCHALGALIYLFLSHGIDVNPGFGDLYFTFDVGLSAIECLVSILGA